MRLAWIIISLMPALSVAFEPFSTTYLGYAGYAAVASIAGYFYSTYDACEKKECCKHPWVNDYPYLDFSALHGQPLVNDILTKVIKRRPSYDRPLLLSFHGPVGTGKTFLSTLLSNKLYKLGKESGYVHFFSVAYHFSNPSEVSQNEERLRAIITGSLIMCPKSVFIFDEFDKMPPELVRTIAAFLEPRGRISTLSGGGTSYSNVVRTGDAIFILLSNTGSKAIVKKSYELYRKGIERNSFKLGDFEEDLKDAIYNEDGAFKESILIKKELVDAYVPFLPLEKDHVRSCIIAEFRRFHHRDISEEAITEIMDGIKFSQELNNLYAETGCKKVLALVARY